METEFISLNMLAKNLQVYEHLPVPIQEALKKSIWITFAINIICIPILLYLPEWISSIAPIRSAGFFIWFTSNVANSIFNLAVQLNSFLLTLNLVSFACTVIVLLASQVMTKDVVEPFHWLAWAAAFPCGISALTLLALTIFFVATIVLALIIWVILITIAVTIIVGVLAGLAGGG